MIYFFNNINGAIFDRNRCEFYTGAMTTPKTITFIILALVASSCTASRFRSNDAVASSFKGGVQIVHAADDVNVSDGVQLTFNEQLAHHLFCHKGFNHGNDVSVEYRFTQFNRGSRILKCLGGGLSQCSQGSVTVEAVCKDSEGNLLGQVQSEARISSALNGRSIDQAIFETAEEIASYAASLLNQNGKSLT